MRGDGCAQRMQSACVCMSAAYVRASQGLHACTPFLTCIESWSGRTLARRGLLLLRLLLLLLLRLLLLPAAHTFN